MKITAAFLLFPAVCTAQVVIGSGVTLSPGALVGGTFAGGGPISFIPASGTYTGAQTVAIAGPLGTTCFYTTDGSTPNIASTQYTAPVTVSASGTLNVACVQASKVYQNVQTTSAKWKCVTLSGSPSPCQAGGGVVGTISAQSQSYGSTATLTASTVGSTGENQILFVNTQAGAGGAATMLAEDKIFRSTGGSSIIANNELDMNLNDASRSRYHAGGLQCNQQAGHLQWQIDNQQGSWQNTGITYGCPISTTQDTEIRYSMHWTNGDTGCGGYGCDHYDMLTVCVGGVCHDNTLNMTLEAYTEPWSDSVIIQDQLDLTNTTQSGQNPTTGARTLKRDNITAGVYSTLVTGAASYTIN